MGGSEEENGDGMVASVKRGVARFLDIVRTRVDLFAVELQLEKSRLLEMLFLTVVLGGLVLLGIAALSTALVLLFPEETRVAALFGLAGLYLVAAFAILVRIRRRAESHKPFRHTLEELSKDKSCLDDPNSSN
jgi:uncharacterized membrane protein YqjE